MVKPEFIIIASVVLAVGLFAAFAFLMIQAFTRTGEAISSAASIASTHMVETQIDQPAPASEPVSEPAQAAQDAPVEARAIQSESEPTPAPEPAQPVPYAAQMSAAGIDPANHSTVHTLLFIGDQWNLAGPAGIIGSREPDPIARFAAIDDYVLSTYGSWAGAQAHAQANEGKW